jgi:hypothetical protein
VTVVLGHPNRPLAGPEAHPFIRWADAVEAGAPLASVPRQYHALIQFALTERHLQRLQAPSRTASRRGGAKGRGAAKGQKRYTAVDLLQRLRRLARLLGRTPRIVDLSPHRMPAVGAFVRQFGSFARACREAGFPPNRGGKRD